MAPVPKPLCIADLSVNAMYISPRGHMCRLVPSPKSGPGSGGASFTFEYLTPISAQRFTVPEGFTLSAANVPLMKPGGWR